MSNAYDAGLLGDGGGGDVAWWQDYIRAELERAHEFYQAEIDDLREDRDSHQRVAICSMEEQARLRAALFYYGGHDPDNSDHGEWVEMMNEDGGDTARAALSSRSV